MQGIDAKFVKWGKGRTCQYPDDIATKAYSDIGKSGFDRTNPDSMGDVIYDKSTRSLTIQPKSNKRTYDFFTNGIFHRLSIVQTVACPDVTGSYYWLLNQYGNLQVYLSGDVTEEIFLTHAIVGLAYYNATTGDFWGAVDEQHGLIMDSYTHFNLHLTRGFKWAHEGDIIGLADASDHYTEIEAGLHFDEDIPIVTEESTEHPFMYRDGADGAWRLSTADNKIALMGTTYAVYNEFDGSNWVLTESTLSTDYIIYFFIKTNLADVPYAKIVGQKTYPSRSSARDGLANDLRAVKLSGLSSPETEFQFAWIAKRDGTLEDDGNGNAYVDLRGLSVNGFH